MVPDDESLHKLYSKGLNDYQVADLFHVGRNRLRAWRLLHNIASKTTKKNLASDLCPIIISRLESGMTLTAIADEHKATRSSIAKLLKRNGYLYKVRSQSRPGYIVNYEMTSLQRSILIGDMFGDGSIAKSGPHTAYYHCAHSKVQKFFVDWKYEKLSPMSCRTREYMTYDKRLGKSYDCISMGTWSTRQLGTLFNVFYPNGRGNKILTEKHVKELDWQGLAVWFMGDGTRDRNNMHISIGRHINMIPVAEALNSKFKNIFELKSYDKEWHLNIVNRDIFLRAIESFLLPGFNYKTTVPHC